MRTKLGLIALILSIAFNISAQYLPIIPKPSELTMNEGVFTLDNTCSIKYDSADEEVSKIADLFGDYMENAYSLKFNNTSNKTIELKLVKRLGLNPEGYLLTVDPNSIIITASEPNGLFYGTQTLKQMLPVENSNGKLDITAIDIKDQPRFSWRGNMLDVGRHFFPVSFIKRYIDILAMYKINTLHWHLTEDQGWRIEIKKYPLLTEISHWRDETWQGHYTDKKGKMDGIGYGGFYTQEQCKEIVRYAEERYITVVPEIEMPGHSCAALAAYPHLGCTGGPYEVKGIWGVHKDVYCAGKEETINFLQDVLNEVLEIFPSEFIHIGGDECPKDAWKECAACQKRIKEEGLKDEHELQSWFITEMDKFLTSKGRRLIGWDEILEGGLAPEATVMSWRGIKGGIEAARQKHDVVMSPTTHMYIDYYQSRNKKKEPLAIGGYLPVQRVYDYEPIPKELTADEAKYIMGVQTNLWTEYIATTKKAEYMLLPRLQAQAEVAWTPKELKNFKDFEKRLIDDYKLLDKLGINYRNHKK